jgi:hypothetical protein
VEFSVYVEAIFPIGIDVRVARRCERWSGLFFVIGSRFATFRGARSAHYRKRSMGCASNNEYQNLGCSVAPVVAS